MQARLEGRSIPVRARGQASLRITNARYSRPARATRHDAGMSKPTRVAFNAELLPVDGKAPEWVELIPAPDADGMVKGRDGRRWRWDSQAQNSVLAAYGQRDIDLVVDWEHATQRRAPNGEEAPAAAWIPDLEIRDGVLWGRASWTPRAEVQVVNREYRFLSPVFDYDPSTLRIVRMATVGLVNTPNLRLQALNSEEDTYMKRSALLVAAITTALGLTETAEDDAVAQAINSLKADKDGALSRAENAERTQPSLDRYVPRSDFDALATRAQNAEQQLKDRDATAFAASVDVAINGALEAGKITPAAEGFYRASCSDAEGLKRFQDFVGVAPAVGDNTNLDKRKPEDTQTALNAEEQAVVDATGITPEAFLAQKKSLAG